MGNDKWNKGTLIQPTEPPPKSPAAMIDYDKWTRDAIEVSQSFEGSDPWANITGNFDGAYLTCGALGFTWLYNNQPPMILDFVKRHGEARARQLMPTKWDEYYGAAKKGEKGGSSIVASWSNGSSSVREPYKSELAKFWKSPEMKQIQVLKAWDMMGAFAKKKTQEGQLFFELATAQFGHFAYWFDQAVLNGQGNTIAFADAAKVTSATILDWMKDAPGYTTGDLRKNRTEWEQAIKKASADRVALWKMAYLRAQKSRDEFKPVTMNRRGTLALGAGWVNGTHRSYEWANSQPGKGTPPVEPPPTPGKDLVQIALANGLNTKAATHLRDFVAAKHPGHDPTNWAILDMDQHSKTKRLSVINKKTGAVAKYLAAHGKGSDADHNGYAEKFSNVSGSNCTSLGIVRCSEIRACDTHGRELILDGLEATNSNTRERAIVMHSADYVSDAYVAENEKCGRSLGCPAIDHAIRDKVIEELRDGSFMIIWSERT